MKTIIEVLGDITETERRRLEEGVRLSGWHDLVPGDGFVVSQVDGQPPKIAYLNRRIHLLSAEAQYKLIFEVGIPVQRGPKLNKEKLFKELQDFVVRKSAVFTRPDMAARELTNFFVTFTGE